MLRLIIHVEKRSEAEQNSDPHSTQAHFVVNRLVSLGTIECDTETRALMLSHRVQSEHHAVTHALAMQILCQTLYQTICKFDAQVVRLRCCAYITWQMHRLTS